jgi:RNA polymerase sigma-70 factor (ECF subfamily)
MIRPTLLSRSSPDPRSLADEDLMARVYEGDSRAFAVIFDRHGAAAFSLAYRICGRRGLAEDVVQEAFLGLWRSRGRYDRARGSVRTWVLTLVHHRAVDVLRHELATSSRDIHDDGVSALLPARELTDAEAQRRSDAQIVRDAMGQLPAEQRQVIELAYFGGFTHSELAEMLDLPAGTVKGRMRLGLAKLRLALGDVAESVV